MVFHGGGWWGFSGRDLIRFLLRELVGLFVEGVEMAFRGVTFLVMGVFYCVKVVRGECGAMV